VNEEKKSLAERAKFLQHKAWNRKNGIPFIYARQNVMLCGRVAAKIYDQIDLYELLCCSVFTQDNNTQGATLCSL
jgi:hypothetical protein